METLYEVRRVRNDGTAAYPRHYCADIEAAKRAADSETQASPRDQFAVYRVERTLELVVGGQTAEVADA